MNRSFAKFLIATAALACAGVSASFAQQPETQARTYEPEDEVVTRIVRRFFNEDQMEEVAKTIAEQSNTVLENDILSITIMRGSVGAGYATREEITLDAEALYSRLNTDHCYGRFLKHKTVNDGDQMYTSVWCQSPDYKESPLSDRRLEWDIYENNHEAAFRGEISPSHRCFKPNSDEPNLSRLTLSQHSVVCGRKLNIP